MKGAAMDGEAKVSRDPVQIVVDIEEALKPTKEDLLYSLNRQITRIKDRTDRGVDYQEKPFAPYSTKGPVYWYPSVHLKNRQASRNRFYKQIDGANSGAAKTSAGVKFANYAALKQAVTGSSTVNLMGLRAPHMMMQIVARVRGLLATIGIYGDAADRADAINNGTAHMPKREFFNASDSDKAQMASELIEAGVARANKPNP